MIELVRTATDDSDFQALIEKLDQDLWSRYPETQQFFQTFNKIKLDARAVVAYENGEPAGCGCFRETGDGHVVEIKRMYVIEAARGRGIARQILQALEEWAKEAGKRQAVLETGINQPEAISLYKKGGYRQIDRYEPYVDREDSICMGKQL